MAGTFLLLLPFLFPSLFNPLGRASPSILSVILDSSAFVNFFRENIDALSVHFWCPLPFDIRGFGVSEEERGKKFKIYSLMNLCDFLNAKKNFIDKV